ncbi:MAG: Holliday junction resolvase RuvX [Cyclobacteriaceae bacterium]
MARIIAIDYGTKRVGLAVTDPLQLIASPLDTIHSKDILNYLTAYFKQEEVEAIVLGMPTRLDGSDTHSTQHVVGFKRKLEKIFPNITLHLADERYTSKLAFSAMIEGGLKKKARQNKELVDKLSATIILQSFMNAKK